ncbi:MAG: hypothetical protein RMM51_01395 [Verrucomicrobiae bacterium]|nr:hypothetical protein [Verrucomicrobiae bacterium]
MKSVANESVAKPVVAASREPVGRWEWIAVAAVLIVAGWLRLSHLDLVEFKADEAVAAHLALQFVRGGELPSAGLMSSVGVTNPPLFIYLLIPMFWVTTNVVAVSAMIAVLGVAAVGATWWFTRRYVGRWAALVAATMFATGPWPVIYSRKIWAQDFMPLCATGLVWALFALVCGGNRRAVFWVVLLPLAMVQIHFSGLAVVVAVLVILGVLRPRMDWRWAVAGGAVAVVLLVPYLRMQMQNDWEDFRRARAQIGGQKWNIPRGMTIQPDSGYPLPRRPSEAPVHAWSVVNSGQIEDVIGLDKPKWEHRAGLWEMMQAVQRWLAFGCLVWLAIEVGRHQLTARRAIVLLGLLVVPVAVFMAASLWTYLSYYAILWPVWFLVVGEAVESARASRWPWLQRGLPAAALGLCALSVVYMVDLYRFIEERGGAHGTYGTGVGYKMEAARWLAGATNLWEQQRLLQMDRLGRVELAQIDLPFLIWLETERRGSSTNLPAANEVVLVYDSNRANYRPEQVSQLTTVRSQSFGPMRLFFVPR